MTPTMKRILQAVIHLGGNAYGAALHEHINRTHYVSLGTIYLELEDAERRGLVGSRIEPGDSKRNYHSRVYWYLTRQGIEALEVTA